MRRRDDEGGGGCCLRRMLMREPQHLRFSQDSAPRSTNASLALRIDAPCSLKLPAPSRGLTAAPPAAGAGTAWAWAAARRARVTCDAVETQPRTRPVVAGKLGRRVQSLAPLRGGAVGRCWEADVVWRRGDEASSPRAVARVARRASLRRDAGGPGGRGRGRVLEHPVEAHATRRPELRTPALGSA